MAAPEGEAAGPGGLDFLPGQTFARRFTIIERIGEGGMGVVYKAIDKALDCAVALKLIRPDLSRNAKLVERFRREVRITRQITHPNICRVHDIGEADGLLYLSMEWIEGESLHELLQKTGGLNEGRALQIASKIARGLEAAHEQKVIHRDLKPANVMVDRHGNVHILDFGLAMEQGAPHLTRDGAHMGTPLYMAPEQKLGMPLDERTDLYALGLILRDMLLGQLKTSGAEVNRLIVPVLDRLLAEHPDGRFASAGEARRALEELKNSPAFSMHSPVPVSRPDDGPAGVRVRVLIVGALVVVVVAVVGYIFFPRDDAPPMSPEALVYYNRGLHYLAEELGKSRGLDEAILFFHKAENKEPDSALIMSQLASAYWFRFRKTRSTASREEAERYIAKAHLIDPTLPELAYARGLHRRGPIRPRRTGRR